MSAINAPYGFMPVSHRSGKVLTHSARGGIASAYGSAIGIGDPVKLLTDGTYALAAAGDLISGVWAGWHSYDAGVWQRMGNWVAGTTWVNPPEVYIWPIEGTVFSAQGAGSVAQTAVGDACDHIAGTVNTRSGRGGSYLATASLAGAGNSAGWKILGLLREVGNAWGDDYTKLLVMCNEPNLGRTAGNAI